MGLADFSPEVSDFLARLEGLHLGEACRQEQDQRVNYPIVSHSSSSWTQFLRRVSPHSRQKFDASQTGGKDARRDRNEGNEGKAARLAARRRG